MRWLVMLAVMACGHDAAPPATQSGGSAHAEVPVGPIRGEQVTATDARLAGCRDADTKLIYVLDDDGRLSSLDPRKLPSDAAFHEVGVIACGPDMKPAAIAVDRNGIAWIVADRGAMYNVSTRDASCRKVGQLENVHDVRPMGMAFVADGPGVDAEKLYAQIGERRLEVYDTTQGLWPVKNATLETGDPDFTGTSEGTVFGLFGHASPPYVQQLDVATGSGTGKRWPIPKPGGIVGWSIAQWAGLFYLFLTEAKPGGEPDSRLAILDRATGEYRTIITHLPHVILGAGASTCAPGSTAPIP